MVESGNLGPCRRTPCLRTSALDNTTEPGFASAGSRDRYADPDRSICAPPRPAVRAQLVRACGARARAGRGAQRPAGVAGRAGIQRATAGASAAPEVGAGSPAPRAGEDLSAARLAAP